MRIVQEISLLQKVDFGAEGVNEVLQNVRFILSTVVDSCVMDRGFGIVGDSVDGPIEYVKARLALSCIEAVQKYEPRAQIESIDFEGDPLNGRLIPKAKVVIVDGEV
jgi:uncharacterized protein